MAKRPGKRARLIVGGLVILAIVATFVALLLAPGQGQYGPYH